MSLQVSEKPNSDHRLTDDESPGASFDNEDEIEVTGSGSIAGKEDRMVKYSKVLVVAVIVLVATVMGSLTYVFVREQEESAFYNHVSLIGLVVVGGSLFSFRLSLMSVAFRTVLPSHIRNRSC
jgi:hypothetical protein